MQDDDIDVVGLFTALRRKWWLIILVAIITMVGLFLFLSSIPPRYDSDARIIFEDKENSLNRVPSEDNTQPVNDKFNEEAVRTQAEVITSDKVALEIIKRFDLEKKDEFFETSFLDAIGDYFDPKGREQQDSEPQQDGSITTRQSEVLGEFKKRLTVYPIEQTNVIVIEFWSTDPALAQQVPNAIAQYYAELQEEKKKELTNDAAGFLGPVVEEYTQLLAEAEAEVALEREKGKIFRSGTSDNSLETQKLSEISTELSRMRAERTSAQAKVASIRTALRSGGSLDTIPEVIESNLIQRLREREAEVRAQISDLSITLLPNHPRLQALESQVDNFQVQIRSAANNILVSLENNVNLARQTEAELESEIVQLKEDVEKVNRAQAILDTKIRKADNYRDLLKEYESRQIIAISSSNLSPIDVDIYPSASIPVDPYFPKVIPFTIAGTVAAIMLTILGILAITLITGINSSRTSRPVAARQKNDAYLEEEIVVQDEYNNDVRQDTQNTSPPMQDAQTLSAPVMPISKEEVAVEPELKKEKPVKRNPFAQLERVILSKDTKLGIRNKKDTKPIVPEVTQAKPDSLENKPLQPEIKTKKNNFSNSDASDAIAVRYATSVLKDIGEGRIIVSSPGGDRGSKAAWILARQLNYVDNNGVVIIDLSGGGATANEMLGGNDLPGIFDLISGNVSIKDIIYRDQESATHVVPAGHLSRGSSVPDSLTMSNIIDAIAMSYNYCIVDCGDADIDGINLVATDDAIVIISGINARRQTCEELEAELKEDGFADILHILPDEVDNKGLEEAAEPA